MSRKRCAGFAPLHRPPHNARSKSQFFPPRYTSLPTPRAFPTLHRPLSSAPRASVPGCSAPDAWRLPCPPRTAAQRRPPAPEPAKMFANAYQVRVQCHWRGQRVCVPGVRAAGRECELGQLPHVTVASVPCRGPATTMKARSMLCSFAGICAVACVVAASWGTGPVHAPGLWSCLMRGRAPWEVAPASAPPPAARSVRACV